MAHGDRSERKSRRRVVAAFVVALGLVALLLGVAVRSDETACSKLTLTPEKWRAPGARDAKGGDSARQVRADDAMRCNAFRGRSKDQVNALVGHPGGSPSDDSWEWIIGRDRRSGGFPGAAYEALVVTFGPDDRATTTAITRR